MCRAEDMNELVKERDGNWELDVRHIGKVSTIKNRFLRLSRARLKLWTLRAITTLLIWTCIVQLVAIGEVWGPRLLKTFPSCSSPFDAVHNSTNQPFIPSKAHFPPKRKYRSNGYLLVSCNGGLNQMRAAICDMVAISRYLNLTLLVPELDKTSFWADPSDFKDIFDVNHFITSLRDEVRIVKDFPPKLKRRFELKRFHQLSPVSWSNISYYQEQVLPLIKKHKIVHFNRTDARLANNGLPLDIQKLRCKVNFNSLRFTPQIERLGNKVVRMLRRKGPFLVLHLRYEMDMLSFSGCTQACNAKEVKELTRMRYANRWWKEKDIDPIVRRKEGLCPLTPEEAAIVLRALGIDRNMQIYIAAGEIYGAQRRLRALTKAFPNVVKKETLLEPSDLQFFKNRSSQMAALDYLVSLESDVFIPTYDGNMAKVVEGHRRYLGFKKTILLDRRALISLIDRYVDGSMRWDEFSYSVKELHQHNRMNGSPKKRSVIHDKPKEEDYFYSNPQECFDY